MAGKPFKVGRFAHTLRVRLMREHLGVDVDSMYEEDLMAHEPVQHPHDIEEWDPDVEQEYGKEHGVTHVSKRQRRTATKNVVHDTVDAFEQGLSTSAHIKLIHSNTSQLFMALGMLRQRTPPCYFGKLA
jgi:phospholipase D1/2